MVDLSVLKDLDTGVPGAWQSLSPDRLEGKDLDVLAYDQSLTATGVVLLSRRRNSLTLCSAHTIKPPKHTDDLVSFEQDFERAIHLEEEVYSDIVNLEAGPMQIAFETPPVINKRTLVKVGPRAGTPARMGGQAIWSAARKARLSNPVMVNSQQAKKLVCGNAKADKGEAHAALKRDVFPWLPGSEKVTNEAQRDALLVALVVMSRG